MIIGIDLGTSTSEVAYLKDGKPRLITEVRESERGILPSVVALNRQGEIRVGLGARATLSAQPENGVEEIKRKMGSDERVRVGADEYAPQEISAFILLHLKAEAERFLDTPVTDAVITVPAYFTDAQRQATKDAGELAGLRVRRLINEPTAAALAYGLERSGVEEKILVYDLGGGTLDVTVLELSEGVLDVFASTGNSKLGGKEFDERLMTYLAEECRRTTGIDPLRQSRSRQNLRVAARRAKESLSTSEFATVLLENLGMAADQTPVDFETELSREKFEELIRDLVESTRLQIDEALSVKALQPADIDRVLLIGGSTRVPCVRSFVGALFSGKPVAAEVNPDEAVCLGAAVLAGIVGGDVDAADMIITDVSAFSFGVSVQRDIDDEVVSGVFDPLIERHATLPRTVRRRYQTSRDWQDAVHVMVFQGEGDMCRDNDAVTDFLHPMAIAPAGAPVDIEMSYDLNGIIKVSAQDPSTGKSTEIVQRVGAGRMDDSQRIEARKKVERIWSRGSARSPHPARPTATQDAVDGAATGSKDGRKQESWRDSPLYPGVAALMAHAEKRLASLAGQELASIQRLLGQLKRALEQLDASSVERHETELTDILFDLD